MPRYIDADKLPELFDIEYKKTRRLIEGGEDQLDNLAEGFTEATRVIRFVAKTEDVAPVVHAHWEVVDEANPFLAHGRCSHCGFEQWIYEQWIFDGLRYCAGCGAKMDEMEEDTKHDCE